MTLDPIRWQGNAGINVFWPIGGPVRSGGVYPADPYSIASSGAWATHVTAAVLQSCLDMGFDHFRLQPSPAPFLEAMAAGDTAKVDGYHTAMDAVVADCINAGIKVMYSPFLSSPNIEPTVPLQGIETADYIRYRDWLVATAQRYVSYGDDFAIGTMNEPPWVSSFPADWPNVVQPDLFAAIRAVAPDMTIAVTSADYSSHHLLAGSDWSGTQTTANGLDPAMFDANTLYEFHPFLPAPFCLAGAAYNDPYKYVPDLTWPPNPAEKTTMLAAMEAKVNADGTLSGTDKTNKINSLTTELGYFFDMPQGKTWIANQINYVEVWRTAKGLPPNAVYAGEYGKTRDNASWAGGTRLNRIRYHRDLSAVLLPLGYRVAADHLDTYDYGVTHGTGETIGAWDIPLMKAITPGMFLPLAYKP